MCARARITSSTPCTPPHPTYLVCDDDVITSLRFACLSRLARCLSHRHQIRFSKRDLLSRICIAERRARSMWNDTRSWSASVRATAAAQSVSTSFRKIGKHRDGTTRSAPLPLTLTRIGWRPNVANNNSRVGGPVAEIGQTGIGISPGLNLAIPHARLTRASTHPQSDGPRMSALGIQRTARPL